LAVLVRHLDDDLTALGSTLAQLNGSVLPPAATAMHDLHGTLSEASSVLSSDSNIQQELRFTLEESRNAFRAIRSLADTLNRHPESLIRGIPADPQATASGEKTP
jgi:paraquat-inducible protein B